MSKKLKSIGYLVVAKYLQQDDVNDPIKIPQESIKEIGRLLNYSKDYELFTRNGKNNPISMYDYYTLHNLNLTIISSRQQKVLDKVYDFFDDKNNVDAKIEGRLYCKSNDNFGNFRPTKIILQGNGYGKIPDFCLELTSNNNSVEYISSDENDNYVLKFNL